MSALRTTKRQKSRLGQESRLFPYFVSIAFFTLRLSLHLKFKKFASLEFYLSLKVCSIFFIINSYLIFVK